MPKLPQSWPTAAVPRLLNRELAAAYCGVSTGTFDAMVEEGFYPRALRVPGRRLLQWDRDELDAAITARRLNQNAKMDWLAAYR